MNARQKAKHYKKLYEQMKLPIYSVDRTNLQHYRIEKMSPFDNVLSSPEIAGRMIMDSILKDLEPIIKKNICFETNNQYREVIADIDIWLKE